MNRTFEMTSRHLSAFARQQALRFEDEMVAHLRREYPAESSRMGESRLRELIRTGIERARTYHIVLEADVAGYIELMLAVSPDFDHGAATPWAGAILSQRIPGAAKLEQILERLVFEAGRRET